MTVQIVEFYTYYVGLSVYANIRKLNELDAIAVFRSGTGGTSGPGRITISLGVMRCCPNLSGSNRPHNRYEPPGGNCP